jgi:hypothetical protein
MVEGAVVAEKARRVGRLHRTIHGFRAVDHSGGGGRRPPAVPQIPAVVHRGGRGLGDGFSSPRIFRRKELRGARARCVPFQPGDSGRRARRSRRVLPSPAAIETSRSASAAEPLTPDSSRTLNKSRREESPRSQRGVSKNRGARSLPKGGGSRRGSGSERGTRRAVEPGWRPARRCVSRSRGERERRMWWRRRESNPRPEALRERPLHAQPLLGSRHAASRRGKTAARQPRIRFAAPSRGSGAATPAFRDVGRSAAGALSDKRG